MAATQKKATYAERIARMQNPDGSMRFLPKSQWVPDKQGKKCYGCSTKFSMSTRRHHCRCCGNVTCQNCSDRRHPKYPDQRICFRCYSLIMVAQNKLQEAAWYHGQLSRQSAEQRLLSPGTRFGDFMVRESASVDGFIAVSIRAEKKVLHYLVHEKGGRFFIGNEPTVKNKNKLYASIQNLITDNKQRYHMNRAMIVATFTGDTCPGCAATVKPTDLFCDECGRRLQSTKEEIQVYEDAADDDTYEGDGHDFPPQMMAPSQQQFPPQQQQFQQPPPQQFQQPPPQQFQQPPQQQFQQPPQQQFQQPPQQQFQQPPQQQFQQQQPVQPYAQPNQVAYPAAAPVAAQPPAAARPAFCGNCGSKVNDTMKFCGGCGNATH